MKKPAMKQQSGLRICFEFDEPTTICEKLQRTERRGDDSFEHFETEVDEVEVRWLNFVR